MQHAANGAVTRDELLGERVRCRSLRALRLEQVGEDAVEERRRHGGILVLAAQVGEHLDHHGTNGAVVVQVRRVEERLEELLQQVVAVQLLVL